MAAQTVMLRDELVYVEDEEVIFDTGCDGERNVTMEEKQDLAEIYAKVHQASNHIWMYIQLGSFVLFTALYITVVYLQANSFLTYEISTSHQALLPPGASATAPVIFSKGPSEIYDWLNESFIQTVWADPLCGNGICESPTEHEQFGRFGCLADCGKFANTTRVVLSLSNDFTSPQEQAAASWNLCMSRPVGFCWYSSDQVFLDLHQENNEIQLDLPDGDWKLQLNAPSGGVEGQIFLAGDVSDLLRFGGCNETQPLFDACREACASISTCIQTYCEPSADYSGDLNYTISTAFSDCATVCAWTPEAVLDLNVTSCSDDILFSGENPFLKTGSLKCNWTQSAALAPAPAPTSTRSGPPPPVSPTVGGRRLFQSSEDDYWHKCTAAAPSTSAAQDLIWSGLGRDDDERNYRMDQAVTRAFLTLIKDTCIGTYRFSQNHAIYGMAAFMKLYMGASNSSTNFTDTEMEWTEFATWIANDTSVYGLLSALHKAHPDHFGRDQVNRFIDILVAAIASVGTFKDDYLVDLGNWLHRMDDCLADSERYTCREADHVLPWASGSQLNHTVSVGDTVEWTWTDDNPHSIEFVNSSALTIGDTAKFFLYGFGGGRWAVSRKTKCSPDNLHKYGVVPCVLELPSEGPSTFKYCHHFSPKEFPDPPYVVQYSSRGYGDSNIGYFTILEKPKSPPYVSNRSYENFVPINYQCSENCPLSQLSNGKCDPACNNFYCAYDGGDCSCSLDEAGLSSCACPAGQARGDEGLCCVGGAIGSNLQFTFSLRTYGENLSESNANFAPSSTTPLTRTVAIQNRVVIGLLLSQERTSGDLKWCNQGKFSPITKNMAICSRNSNLSWGVASPFLPNSVLYNSTYADEQSSRFQELMCCTEERETEFNPNGSPFGFRPAAIEGIFDVGFRYIFDINLGNEAATELLQYLTDGFFYDTFTKSGSVQLLTYNPKTRFFTLTQVKLDFHYGGKIVASSNIESVKVEVYSSTKDWVRLGLEIVYVVGLIYSIFDELREFMEAYLKRGNFLYHFTSIWNCIDALSLGIMTTGVILWLNYAFRNARSFNTNIKFRLYGTEPGQFFQLLPDTQLPEALKVFTDVEEIIFIRTYYVALQGINIFLMVLRILKLMDFQPRMGTITRTIAVASMDLIHFLIMFSVIFIGYAVYGHVVFGRTLEQFSTLGVSLDTMFNVLVGDTSLADYLIELKGWELAAAVLYWWSYVLVVNFITFNLLIAIVIEAYMEVRKYAEEAPSMPGEVWWILRATLRRLLFSPYKTDAKLLRDLRRLGANDHLYVSQKSLVGSFGFGGPKNEAKDSLKERQRVVKLGEREYSQEELSSLLMRAQTKAGIASSSKPDRLADVLLEQFGEHRALSTEKRLDDDDDTQELKDNMKTIMASLQLLVEARLSERLERIELKLQSSTVPTGNGTGGDGMAEESARDEKTKS